MTWRLEDRGKGALCPARPLLSVVAGSGAVAVATRLCLPAGAGGTRVAGVRRRGRAVGLGTGVRDGLWGQDWAQLWGWGLAEGLDWAQLWGWGTKGSARELGCTAGLGLTPKTGPTATPRHRAQHFGSLWVLQCSVPTPWSSSGTQS